jgi:hypothetical protein
MNMKLKPATRRDKRDIENAINLLRMARADLRGTAPKAAKAVSRALKSAEGALRHVERRIAALCSSPGCGRPVPCSFNHERGEPK